MAWVKSKYPGVRYRLHATRKHGIQADKYYVLTYKRDGKTKTEALGWSSEGMTLDRAVEAMAEIKANRRTGTGPDSLAEKKRLALEAKQEAEAERQRIDTEKAAADHAKAERIRLESISRFDAVLDQYCQSHSEKKSLRDEKTLIRLWVQPVIGLKRLQEITQFDIERVKRNMLKAGRAVRSVQYTLAVIRQIYNYAKDRNIFIGESPTKGIKLPKFDNKRMRFLSQDEAQSLLDEIKKHSLQAYRMSLLSLYTGMRLGEICKLTWNCIDLQNNRILIFDPKNGENRTAFMVPIVYQMFSEMPVGEPGGLVFPSKANGGIIFMSKTFNRAVDKLGFNSGITDRRQKIVFHSLRHSTASHLRMAGADLTTIQSILGHQSVVSTERYSKIDNKHIKDAMNRLQERMNPQMVEVIPLAGRAG